MVQRRKEKAFRKVTAQESLEMEARHRRMNSKYLTDAKKLMQQGDYLQASEKYWGAAVQMIKVIAARRGLELGTHRSISDFISVLNAEYPEMNLWTLYAKANNLHMNFYEDHIPPDMVKEHSEAVKELIEKLQQVQ
ncbi:MAG: PaREP1 family protein [Nitrososphaerales archaeon]